MPKRHIFSVSLTPVAGARFQPTGFPDLGAGLFDKPVNGEWVKALLVESEQSMANHLEGTAWDDGTNGPVSAFAGLPYVRVVDADGEYLTSSRTEAHRLSSAFIRDSKLADGSPTIDRLKSVMNLRDDKPLSARHIAGAILKLDPSSLVHGVFFADSRLTGQPKITRALTSFIEAEDVRAAEYGGVKKDDVIHKNETGQGSDEGYGSIPFHRTMWTAKKITGSFVVDLDQIASYGLSADGTRLIEVMALWEIRAILDAGLRLRTMCDLVPTDDSQFSTLPPLSDLSSELALLIASLGDQLGSGDATTLVWTSVKKQK